ncbi:MAG TPA: hypothetical protein VFB98_01405 [Candidatus Deferrimicrobium sp.]|nr:hypothetical protein [Candidatus Deferrimicrobium sp.]
MSLEQDFFSHGDLKTGSFPGTKAALLDAARSHDANAMRAALHAIGPSINIP